MEQGFSCAMCRHWRRVGPRSAVGRCENAKSGQSFTREQACCDRFDILMFLPDRPLVHAPA